MSDEDKKHGIDSDESAVRKIFIGGLNFSTDEDTLRSHFEKYGEVDDVVVMKDPGTNRSRGFGFITYVDIASVDNALSGNRVHNIDSRKVEAKRAVPRSEIPREERPRKGSSRNEGSSSRTSGGASKSSGRSSSKSEAARNDKSSSIADSEEYANNKIFVGGLHYDTREESFRQYFGQFGKVLSAEVMFNRDTGKARGFGFIVFELEQGAIKTAAVKQHFIDGKEVEVKRAIPRSKLPSGTPTPSVLKNNSSTTTSSSSTAAATPPAVRRAESAPAAASATTLSGTSGVRKPLNTVKPSATVPVSQTRSVGSTSYAAALKQGRPQGSGSEGAPADEQPQPESNSSEGSAEASSGSHLLLPNNTATDGGQDGAIQTLLYGDDMNRPYRSNSEPVMEGSSALQGDVLPPDASRQSSAGAIRQTSNNTESSQLMSSNEGTGVTGAGSTSTSNNLSLPWLSGSDSLTGSGIVGSGSLGMAQASDNSGSNNNGNSVGLVPPGMGNVGHLNTAQLQQQMQQMQQLHQLQMQQMQIQMQQMQQAAQLQSQTGGTMMPNGLFLPNTPNSNLFNMTAQQMQFLQQQQALGGAPSPDAWTAALMAQQNSLGGSTSGATIGSQQQGNTSSGIGNLASSTSNSNSGTAPNNQQQGQGQGQQAQSTLFAQNAFGASPFPDYGYLNYMAAMSNGTGQLSDPNMMFYGNPSGATGIGAQSPQFFPQQSNGNNRLGNRSGNQQAVGATSGGSMKNDTQSNAASSSTKRSEESETDELFKFNELNLGNSQFDPTASSRWLS